MTDSGSMSLSLTTTTSSGSPQVAVVGSHGSASHDAAMVDPTQIQSDSDENVSRRLPPPSPTGRRTGSRTGSRGVRRHGKDRPSSRQRFTDNMQTQIDVLKYELSESRRLQRTSEQQVAHVSHIAQVSGERVEAMHEEARHYATEALQHHRSATYRTHQTVRVSGEMTQRVKFFENAELLARRDVLELEQHLASAHGNQQRFTTEATRAQETYESMCRDLANTSASSEQKDSELMAQQSLVSALHNQCSFALRENSEPKSWLAEYHAKYSDSTKIEEQYAQRLCRR